MVEILKKMLHWTQKIAKKNFLEVGEGKKLWKKDQKSKTQTRMQF